MGKRRTPPLFDVLGGTPRRVPTGGGAQVSGPGSSTIGPRAPVEVRVPENGAGGASRTMGVRVPPAVLFMGLALIIALVVVAWSLAFHLGRQTENERLASALPAEPAPGSGNTPGTSTPNSTTPGPSGQGQPGGGPNHTPGPGAVPGGDKTPLDKPQPEKVGTDKSRPEIANPDKAPADPRQAGVNYLHIVTLSWKDAQRAVEYLEKNGVPAFAAPAKRGIDPDEARAKNLNHLVFATQGIPSESYRSAERQRGALIDKVRSIGKKWQKDERGPSDFGEPLWVMFKP